MVMIQSPLPANNIRACLEQVEKRYRRRAQAETRFIAAVACAAVANEFQKLRRELEDEATAGAKGLSNQ